jgi:hypothetical protein
MHSHGETNVTVGAGSLPNVVATTMNANKVNDARFIAPAHITLSLLREGTSNLYCLNGHKAFDKAFWDIGPGPKDQSNRRKYMPDYAVWEIHPVMKMDVP